MALEVSMAKRLLFFVYPVLLIAACSTSTTPTAPTSAPSAVSGALEHGGHGATAAGTASAADPNSVAHNDKGNIDGWFNGEDVQLYYTKSVFCDPLSPTTTVPCELEPRRTRRRAQGRSRQFTPSLPHQRSRIWSIRQLSPAALAHRVSITR